MEAVPVYGPLSSYHLASKGSLILGSPRREGGHGSEAVTPKWRVKATGAEGVPAILPLSRDVIYDPESVGEDERILAEERLL